MNPNSIPSSSQYSTDQIQLKLFGAPQLFINNQSVHLSRRKALALLSYLVVQGRPQSRDTLGVFFWPESRDSRNQVRIVLSVLRKHLGTALINERDDYVTILRSLTLHVDVVQFRALSAASNQGAVRIADLESAIKLVTGEFMAGFTLRGCPDFDDWQQLESRTLEREIERVYRRLIARLEAQQRITQALHYAEQLLARDDLNEATYRLLMRLYAQNQQMNAVTRVYNRCATTLRTLLGITPSQETVQQYQHLLTSSTREHSSPDKHAWISLPYLDQPFFGRSDEVALIAQTLRKPACRLITVLGPGGIGKTHLATKISTQMQGVFADGVYFVPLETTTDNERCALAIANALQIRLFPDAPTLPQLTAHCRERQILLVLDNLEHLMPDIPNLVAELLLRTMHLKVLATSRTKLHLHEEHVVRLAGLPYPHPEQFPLTVTEARTFDAVAFFVYWAQKASPQFVLNADNVVSVGRICALLDGVPLAIRLAATWCAALSAADLLQEMQTNLDLLQEHLANVPQRHHSIRSLFNSVWERLEAQEQRVFAQLSIFVGGFTLQAARDIVGLSLLQIKALLDKSLLSTSIGIDGRYHIHGILRSFAAEKLSLVDIDCGQLYQRYIGYYVEFVKQREPDLRGANQLGALVEIDHEISNIQRAWLLAAECHNSIAIEEMIEGFSLYLKFRGLWMQGFRLFPQIQAALAVTQDADSTRVRHKLAMRFYLTTPDHFYEMVQLCRAARERGDHYETAYLTAEIGWSLRFFGYPDLGLQYSIHALRQYRQLADSFHIAAMLTGIAYAHVNVDDFSAATLCIQESFTIQRQLGNQFGIAENQLLAGEIALMQGELETAYANLRAAFDFLNAHEGEAAALNQACLLPWCCFFAGEITQSASLAQRMLEMPHDESTDDYALALCLLSLIAYAQNRPERSRQLFSESIQYLTPENLQATRWGSSTNDQLLLFAECATAIILAFDHQFDRSQHIITRLLQSPTTHRRPFIVELLFTTDVLILFLKDTSLVNEALKSWLIEQKWLKDCLNLGHSHETIMQS